MKKRVITSILSIFFLLLCGCAPIEIRPAETPRANETLEPASEPTNMVEPTPMSTTEPLPEAVDYSFQAEVSDYFFRCEDIVDILPEGTTRESWIMSEVGWHYQGFWFVYEDDSYKGRIFSMKNEQANGVTLYGGHVGESYTEFEKGLIEAGWKASSIQDDIHEYGVKMQGTCFLADLFIDEDGIVTGWFLGNWPQGDYEEFFSQFDI